MGAGTLTIYSASAGSGKTFRLTGIYLEKLFRSHYSYRKILAVTFTHKATAEMKGRILDELNNLGSGSHSEYLAELMRSTNKSEETIRKEAKEILYSVLHDFSRFSVSTIDSFFQKILRAFARERGLHSGYNVEMDHAVILSSAVDRMIASAGTDTTLKDWLFSYVRSNIGEGKSWDLKKSIINLAEEIFSERFKLLSPEEKEKLQDKEFLKAYIKEIKSVSSRFLEEIRKHGNECSEIFKKHSLSDDMFFQKGRGVPGFIKQMVRGEAKKTPNNYVRAIFENPPKWCSGKLSGPLKDAVDDGLDEAVKNAVRYFDDNISDYKSASVILSNIFALGILSDVLNQVSLITTSENTFLLSNAGEFIYLITKNDQAPFIYEKVGNVFENFMIDEFQDTSLIQWKNFSKLIDNSMAQGFDNLVVGDIKQSIYRWRNSDWRTLFDLTKRVDNERYKSISLNVNWRSCQNIIRFNNTFFSIIPQLLDAKMDDKNPDISFNEIFAEVVQSDPGERSGGYVKLEFVEDNEESTWKESVLQRLPAIIESLQDKGYSASDIGILVRNNSEGAEVLKSVISYSSTCPPDKCSRYTYNIVSNDSLLLCNSPAVNFLIAVMTVLDNPDDMIARAQMLRFFLLATGSVDAGTVPLVSKDLIASSAEFLPEGYVDFLEKSRFLPLWDITEKSIGFFGLGLYSFNVAYLNCFQDIIVNFTAGKNPGIPAFLEWWDSEGYNKSVSLPGQQDAMKVLTIHKSKGLEFRAVILPFLSWNLDHKSYQSNILWVRPGTSPFDKLGIVPVRYKSDLSGTIFSKQYRDERLSAYLDNINLLYVAFTRAKNVLYGFAPDKPKADSGIATVIREALEFNGDLTGDNDSLIKLFFDPVKKALEFGEIPQVETTSVTPGDMKIEKYHVSSSLSSLKLKLHWESYLNNENSDVRNRINYGKLMHSVFEKVICIDDVHEAVRKMVLEGNILENEAADLESRIRSLLNQPVVKDWFDKDNKVLNEASILIPHAGTKRPDRIIFRNGRIIIIDFKFGEENPHYLAQIKQYCTILNAMGYNDVKAFLWFVDDNKIIPAE